jgi:hypothetical protein
MKTSRARRMSKAVSSFLERQLVRIIAFCRPLSSLSVSYSLQQG